MISRIARCSAQPAAIPSARFGPMPATSRRRCSSASMTSNTWAPKAWTSLRAYPSQPRPSHHRSRRATQGAVRRYRPCRRHRDICQAGSPGRGLRDQQGIDQARPDVQADAEQPLPGTSSAAVADGRVRDRSRCPVDDILFRKLSSPLWLTWVSPGSRISALTLPMARAFSIAINIELARIEHHIDRIELNQCIQHGACRAHQRAKRRLWRPMRPAKGARISV